MYLKELFENTGVLVTNNFFINKIEVNSKNIVTNDLFVAIKGFEKDGHNYIDEAIKKGAKVVLINEDRYDSFKDLNIILLTCKNTRNILGIISSNYYKNPSKYFKLIGITGTKGKTTTSYMIKSILEKANKKVGIIGTLGSFIGKKRIRKEDRTTPDSLELQKIFNEMKEEKCEFVILEVSSQSLKLNRVTGSYFDVCIFTNFSVT